jgi:hypothetical protein
MLTKVFSYYCLRLILSVIMAVLLNALHTDALRRQNLLNSLNRDI